MPTKTSLWFLTATALLTPGFLGSAAGAAQTSGLVPAQVTFADAPGDRILSDSYGPTYQDGQLGVKCVFHDPAFGGTGDLTFFTTSNGAPVQQPRTMTFLFNTPFNPGCPFDLSGGLPASTQSASLTVRQIYQLPISPAPVAVQAIFFLSDGTLYFSQPGFCSTPVQVTHPDASHWIISATPTPAPTAAGAGDIVVLRQPIRGQIVLTKYWEMPFTITASTLP